MSPGPRGAPSRLALAFLWSLPRLRCLALQQPRFQARRLSSVRHVFSGLHRSH